VVGMAGWAVARDRGGGRPRGGRMQVEDVEEEERGRTVPLSR
jgi:hypothetical protein